MDHATVIAWVASMPGIGPKRFRDLVRLVPDFALFVTASSQQLLTVGISPIQLATLLRHRQEHPLQQFQEQLEALHVHLLVHPDVDTSSSAYPPLLAQISDAPIVLYTQGTIPDWSVPGIAMVGTRQMTAYGEQVTKKLTQDLVHAGVMIISGFMYGVDATAHGTALDEHGKTVGVLGFGFDHMYPAEHRALASRMIASGNCLLCEYPPWQPPTKHTFPARNRIVSGLSLGIVVTEAASKSGTKITASCAVEQGREVFAVSGPIDSPYSEGTKELVNMGATLVTSVEDILGAFSL